MRIALRFVLCESHLVGYWCGSHLEVQIEEKLVLPKVFSANCTLLISANRTKRVKSANRTMEFESN